MSKKPIKILHTNDLHGSLKKPLIPLLKPARENCDLYFDSGDCVKCGNLGIPLKKQKVWERLAHLNCTASCPGNRESHLIEKVFESKISDAQHPILCANMFRRDGSLRLSPTLEMEINGWKIGLFGVMVPMVTKRMKSYATSQFYWESPLPIAEKVVQELRPKVDLLIALTHIGLSVDQELAKLCPDIDVIFGGHSHNVLDKPLKIGKTYICQGGSHARFYGEYTWDENGLNGHLHKWKLEK